MDITIVNYYVEQVMKTKNIILQKKKQQVGKQVFMMLTRISYIIIGKVDNKDLLDDDYNTDIQKLKNEIKSINIILSSGGRIINEI